MSDWTPIEDPPDITDEDTEILVDCLVTDGENWTRAVCLAGEFRWIKTHLVAKEDATHYLIPELP